MCGFAALFEVGRRFAPELLAGIDTDLYHRGPDSGGRLSEDGVALVIRRLAILDPSEAANQPMTDNEGRCTLVFNGEIYNFASLRRELEARGASFSTTGDSEVLLQGYLEWGEAVLDRLEGMYAFVIVDRARGVAVAARDPFGIKPLYLLRRGPVVALASEMRPLTRLAPPEADPAALAELLTFGWAAGRMSNLKGIERVPGGTVLRISLAEGSVQERRYFDVLDTLDPDRTLSGDEAIEQVSVALRDSVRAHLASDVGYTVQLSGGVDSSLVAALASAETPGRLASFSVNLGASVHDERRYREPVVRRHGLAHHEVPISGVEFAGALPRAVRHMEGPVPHGGCVMLMLLCERIRQVSKVVLTGEGADEMFGGYERYARWRKLSWQETVGRWLPASMAPPVWPFKGVRRLAGRDAAAAASLYRDPGPMHRLFPGLVPGPGARERASARFADFRDRLLAVDQTAYLESLLVRQDKMAMAASVEARVPYVHLPLLRLVNRLPREIRVPGRVTKPLLKAIAERHLPGDLIHRRKVGLLLPYDDWMADPAALGRYLDLLTAPSCRLADFTDRRRLSRVVDAFRDGRRDGLPPMFDLVNVELWLRSLASKEVRCAA